MGIELRNITKKFGATTALNNVSFAVNDGEFVTLLGPSGCGKTTLLRIVAGFLRSDEGEVWIDGKLANDIPPDHRPTGMVFQSYALFPHMTVEKNVSFGLRMQGVPAREIEQRVAKVLDLVGIDELRARYPSQLSGGQQQRVAVARTLAIEPSVLLLDEPLASLDRKLRIEMRTELKKLISRVGITTIFVTHDQLEALTMSDRIAVMSMELLPSTERPWKYTMIHRPRSSRVSLVARISFVEPYKLPVMGACSWGSGSFIFLCHQASSITSAKKSAS